MNSEDLNKIKIIANNALCYEDDSDYGTALWEILEIAAPEIFEDGDEPELELIEKEN